MGQRIQSVQKIIVAVTCAVALLPVSLYFRGFDTNTRRPIQAVVSSKTEAETRTQLQRWLRLKTREAQYVQVAGAVLFASTTSCLSWNALSTAHWSAPALWYATLLLSIPGILLGTQQLSVLPEIEDIHKMSAAQVETMRRTFISSRSKSDRLSILVIFVWQAPRMFFAYAMAFFLAGLFSIVLGPLATRPGWHDEAKTAVIFLAVAAFTFLSFLTVTLGIYRLTKT